MKRDSPLHEKSLVAAVVACAALCSCQTPASHTSPVSGQPVAQENYPVASGGDAIVETPVAVERPPLQYSEDPYPEAAVGEAAGSPKPSEPRYFGRGKSRNSYYGQEDW